MTRDTIIKCTNYRNTITPACTVLQAVHNVYGGREGDINTDDLINDTGCRSISYPHLTAHWLTVHSVYRWTLLSLTRGIYTAVVELV